jgi:pimeloyl-ACP methyl ester carboxylesterase
VRTIVGSGPEPVMLPTTRWGRGDRQVLLAHGLGSSGACWFRVADAVGRTGATVVAPDMRGHGDCPAALDYSAPAQAADLLALAPDGGWDVAVGHSLGALFVLRALAGQPGFARALVLIDPALELSDLATDRLTRDLVAETTVPPSADDLQGANPRWHPDDVRLKLAAGKATGPLVMKATIDHIRPWQHLHLLADVTVPSAVVAADAALDALFTPAQAERVATNELVSVTTATGCGHSVHRDDPGPVVEAVVAALRAAGAPP